MLSICWILQVSEAPPPFGAAEVDSNPTSLATMHQLQLLRAQMDYQNQAAQQALSQVKLLREQLSAENAARIDAMVGVNETILLSTLLYRLCYHHLSSRFMYTRFIVHYGCRYLLCLFTGFRDDFNADVSVFEVE